MENCVDTKTSKLLICLSICSFVPARPSKKRIVNFCRAFIVKKLLALLENWSYMYFPINLHYSCFNLLCVYTNLGIKQLHKNVFAKVEILNEIHAFICTMTLRCKFVFRITFVTYSGLISPRFAIACRRETVTN